MKSKIEKKIKIVLELSDTEAHWLKGYVQNPCCDGTVETDHDIIMRKELFDALPWKV